MDNESVVGRLLEELSWEGRLVRRYRDGGRGLENVLTAEVLMALDFLPRRAFLGAVVAAAHGADDARGVLVREVEDVAVTFLPEEIVLLPEAVSRGAKLIVQPDGMITGPSCQALIEAKRIRRSSFQPRQLACEYLALTRDTGTRVPLLLLLLGAPPPVVVAGGGRVSVDEAIMRYLPSVYERSAHHPVPLADLVDRLPATCAWITWAELTVIVTEQAGRFQSGDPSSRASITRLVASLTRSIARHS